MFFRNFGTIKSIVRDGDVVAKPLEIVSKTHVRLPREIYAREQDLKISTVTNVIFSANFVACEDR